MILEKWKGKAQEESKLRMCWNHVTRREGTSNYISFSSADNVILLNTTGQHRKSNFPMGRPIVECGSYYETLFSAVREVRKDGVDLGKSLA